MKHTIIAWSALLLLPLVSASAQDSMILTDGRFVDGVKIREAEDAYAIVYEHGEILVPKKMVKECYIESSGGFEPRTEEEKAKVEKGLVPYAGRWIKKKKRDQILARKKAEREKKYEELKSHSEWRNRYKSGGKNFEFEYTIDPDIFKGLGDLMNTYYKVFMKDWKLRRPSKLGPLKVCFYHDYESFLQVGGVSQGVQGYYRFVEPRELNFYYNRLDPEYTIEVMFHEACHYLVDLIDLDFSYPHNIGEGLAEYYGASKWDPKKKKMKVGGILEGRLTEVMTDVQGGNMMKLEDYLLNKLQYRDYTWGWTFVHFMMETPKYSKKFKKFFLGLARDKDVKRTQQGRRTTVLGPDFLDAFKRKMRIKDLAKLEQEWHDYIRQDLKLETHRGYEKAARAAMGTGRRVKAKRYYRKAIENGSTNPSVYLQYAGMIMGDVKIDEVEDLVKKAISFDPLHSDSYVYLARVRDAQGNSEEATRIRRLVREMDPENTSVMLDEAFRKKVGKDSD